MRLMDNSTRRPALGRYLAQLMRPPPGRVREVIVSACHRWGIARVLSAIRGHALQFRH
jgi:hypothetical protein